jgi:hypothetical protein
MSKSRRRRSRVTPPRRRRASAPAPTASTPPTASRRFYQQRLDELQPALYPRAFTVKRLNTSIASVLRLEKSRRLDVIRLNPPKGAVYHRAEQVEALARGERS